MGENDIQQGRLQRMIDAEAKALEAQRYKIGDRENERADLGQIQKGIDNLLAGGVGRGSRHSRAKRIVLRDN